MNQADLIAAVAEHAGLTKAAAGKAVDGSVHYWDTKIR
jgi:nucleoid DNA-binding protein